LYLKECVVCVESPCVLKNLWFVWRVLVSYRICGLCGDLLCLKGCCGLCGEFLCLKEFLDCVESSCVLKNLWFVWRGLVS
jgi:hypothetical protein